MQNKPSVKGQHFKTHDHFTACTGGLSLPTLLMCAVVPVSAALSTDVRENARDGNILHGPNRWRLQSLHTEVLNEVYPPVGYKRPAGSLASKF